MNKRKLLTLRGGSNNKAWNVVFNGTSTRINAGSEASIDNLASSAVTIEYYFKYTDSLIILYSKRGGGTFGVFNYISANKILSNIYCATTSALSETAFVKDLAWHHIAVTYDHAGDKKLRTWKDGSLILTSTATEGDVSDDSANTLYFGYDQVSGLYSNATIALGWIRISNSVRYTTNFIAPSRLVYPAVDANTVRLFKMNEGTSTTITDYSTNAQNAILENGTWVKS